jgi:hypothetical protein
MQPVKIINTVINAEDSKIMVYQDGSFVFAHVIAVKPGTGLSGSGTVYAQPSTGEQTSGAVNAQPGNISQPLPCPPATPFYIDTPTSNYLGTQEWDVYYEVVDVSAMETDVLNLEFNNTGSAITLIGAGESASAGTPDVLLSTNLLPFYSTDNVVECEYNYETNAANGSALQTWTDILQIEVTTAGSPSFTLTGIFEPTNYSEPSGTVLNVPKYCQISVFYEGDGNELCWATSAAMNVSYFLNDNIDREIAIAESCYGDSNYNQGAPLLEEMTAINNDVPGLNLPATNDVNGTLSYAAIQQQINAGHPIGTKIAWTAPGGITHAQVITGYNTYNGNNYIYVTTQACPRRN